MIFRRKGVLAFVFCAIAMAAFAHKFYVSISTIDFQKDKGTLEISMKYFRDDLSLALSAKDESGQFKEIQVESRNLESVNVLLNPYIQKHFKLSLNGQPIAYEYLGYESDFDMVYVYVEAKAELLQTIEVHNSVLMDVYEDQVNIIHFQEGKNVASEALKKNRTRVSFDAFED